MELQTKSRTWIQSLGNRKLEPVSLTTEMVGPIEEIAHSLAGEFRFTRQTKERYTVAEHCVRGSRLLPAAFAGAFLLHELSEVYLPDLAAPIKHLVWVDVPEGPIRWADLERQHTRTILEALGLASIEPLIYSPEIKTMDLAMLAAEKRDLCGPSPEDWSLDVLPASVDVSHPWPPEVAYVEFLLRFRDLFE